jgi:hypothetical protein
VNKSKPQLGPLKGLEMKEILTDMNKSILKKDYLEHKLNEDDKEICPRQGCESFERPQMRNYHTSDLIDLLYLCTDKWSGKCLTHDINSHMLREEATVKVTDARNIHEPLK